MVGDRGNEGAKLTLFRRGEWVASAVYRLWNPAHAYIHRVTDRLNNTQKAHLFAEVISSHADIN